MPISGIQGQMLEVTVVLCAGLKNTEFISKQDPYVCVEYEDARVRTRTCTDGGRNPTFREKFNFTLIEGRQEMNVNVWNSNMFSGDDHIGSGRIQLLKVLKEGYDDSSWPLQCKRERHAGEIKLILHYKKLNHSNNEAMPAPSYPPPSAPPQAYSVYPLAYVQPPPSTYPPVGYWPCPTHPPPSYPPPPPYPPQPPVYQPPPYPPTTYPPATYPPASYPPAPYPPASYPGTLSTVSCKHMDRRTDQSAAYMHLVFYTGQYPGAYPPY
ncbi:uncharacterized protein LOC116250328 [Nymphaea colorata]|nr:uncharacterized protein LOC116250328 [Nymphaea colorata]